MCCEVGGRKGAVAEGEVQLPARRDLRTEKKSTSELDMMTMKAAPTTGGERGGAQKMGRLDGVPSVEAGAGNHCKAIKGQQRAR